MRKLPLAVVAIALALAAMLWWQWREPELPPAHTARTQVEDEQRPVDVETGRRVEEQPTAEREAVARAVVEAKPVDSSKQWVIQLVGLDPSVPWTAPIEIVFEQRFGMNALVDADGACRFTPPDGARNPGIQNMRLAARDQNYRLMTSQYRTEYLQLEGRTEVRVQKVSTVRGRVFGPDGVPLFARVRAYPLRLNGPSEPMLGWTESEGDGRFRLQVPPGTPLLLLADAAQEPTQFMGRSRVTAFSPLAPQSDHDSSTPTDEIAMRDQRQARSDRLPATLRAQAVFGQVVELPDMKLTEPAELTGRVVMASGVAVPDVRVVAEPAWAQGDTWTEDLYWLTGGAVARGASVTTIADGTFAMALPPGVPFRVRVETEHAWLHGKALEVTASAPDNIELRTAGELITLRVTDGGQIVPFAYIDVDGEVWRADEHGQLAIGADPRRRVRARKDDRSSPWRWLSADGPVSTIELELQAQPVADVKLDLRGGEVLRAKFSWHSVSGEAPFVQWSSRKSVDVPFAMKVPVGRFRLAIADGAWQLGRYTLPVEVDVEVPAEGLERTLDVELGGRLLLSVFDSHGLRVGGTFRLLDSQRRDVTPATVSYDVRMKLRQGGVGALRAGRVNHTAPLPAGEYSLEVETETGVRAQRMVSVAVGRPTHVDVRLP